MAAARKLSLVALCAPLVLAASGCGQAAHRARGPHAIQVSFTAPTDGASVMVDHLRVFGTVTPRGATVTVAGQPAAAGRGTFNRWIHLQQGDNPIVVEATMDGYRPVYLELHVKASFAPSAPSAPSAPAPAPAATPVAAQPAAPVASHGPAVPVASHRPAAPVASHGPAAPVASHGPAVAATPRPNGGGGTLHVRAVVASRTRH
jgi:Glucodextranase, domain B